MTSLHRVDLDEFAAWCERNEELPRVMVLKVAMLSKQPVYVVAPLLLAVLRLYAKLHRERVRIGDYGGS